MDEMKVLVIGAGMMGKALVYDLAHSEGIERVTIADIDADRADAVAASVGKKVVAQKLDLQSRGDLLVLVEKADVVIGATSYNHNLLLTKAAIESKVHFCDLGGNMDVVDRQLALHEEAERAGVCVLPNCGLAPGMACLIAAGGARKFSRVDTIRLRVGGLPQNPVPPLQYQLVFSVEGLINEYLEPAEVVRNGEIRKVASMTDLENIEFPLPPHTFEAFNTSGGISTLPRMFRGKVHELDYKTIRYRGHCEKFTTLLDLGFASAEPVMVGGGVRTAREIFEELLRRKLPAGGPDLVLMRITVSGIMDNRPRTVAYDMIDYYDAQAQLTSMMRTTAFPTSIIAQMVVRGDIRMRGVFTPEQCVPLEPFLGELRRRNIIIHETWT